MTIVFLQVQFRHHFELKNAQNADYLVFQVKFRHLFALKNVQSGNYFFFMSNLDISLHLQTYKVDIFSKFSEYFCHAFVQKWSWKKGMEIHLSRKYKQWQIIIFISSWCSKSQSFKVEFQFFIPICFDFYLRHKTTKSNAQSFNI